MDDTDASALVHAALQHDDEAARALVRQLYPLVAKIVRAHRPRRTDEEDLCQMIFIKVFQKLDQFSGRVPLEHWVSRIAVNTCLNQINHERHRPELRWADLSEEEEAVVQSLVSTTEEFEASQSVAARELVSKLLAKLSPADRLVVTLMHLEGRSVEEVKRVTGWSGPLVKIRAFRARKKMKKHLQQLVEKRIP